MIGLDVILTSEFANAGWIEPWQGKQKEEATEEVFPSVIETASYEGDLYAAPFNTNTQLLWYRKDLVPKPPTTWDQMIEEAEGLREAGTIQVQAERYEGYMVWVNALIESAGTEMLSGPEEVDSAQKPTEEALAVIGKLANSSAAAPNLSTSNEDSARLGFESGESAFMTNYTFAYASASEDRHGCRLHTKGATFTRRWDAAVRSDSARRGDEGPLYVGLRSRCRDTAHVGPRQRERRCLAARRSKRGVHGRSRRPSASVPQEPVDGGGGRIVTPGANPAADRRVA